MTVKGYLQHIMHSHDFLLGGKHISYWKRCNFCIVNAIYKLSPSSLRTVLRIIETPFQFFNSDLCLLIGSPGPSWAIKFCLLVIWNWNLQMLVSFCWCLEYSMTNSHAGLQWFTFNYTYGEAKKCTCREKGMTTSIKRGTEDRNHVFSEGSDDQFQFLALTLESIRQPPSF